MKKLNIDKRFIFVFSYIFIGLCAVNLTIMPKTNSLFIKNQEMAILYKTSLNDTYKGVLGIALDEKNSSEEKARFRINLTRDTDNVKPGDKDVYILSMPTSCKIVSGSSVGVTNDGNQFTFTKANTTGTGTVEVICDVEENKDLEYLFKLYEKVNNEDKFLYKRNTYKMSYADYKSLFYKAPEDNKIDKNTSEDPYNDFIAIVKKYVESSEYLNNNNIVLDFDKIFKEYFIGKKMGITESTCTKDNCDVLFNDQFNTLFNDLGIKRDNTDTEGIYAFSFDDNFIGYARTYYWFQAETSNNAVTSKRVYFSSNSAAAIENALKYSFANFAFSDEVERELLLNYIRGYLTKNNLTYEMNNFSKIPGVYISKGTDNYPFISFRSNVLDHAYNFVNSKDSIRISNTNLVYMEEVFKTDISFVYPNVSDSAKESINASFASLQELFTSITRKPCSGDTCLPYYEVHYDSENDNYLLIKVTSDGTYNYASIYDLNDINTIKLLANDYKLTPNLILTVYFHMPILEDTEEIESPIADNLKIYFDKYFVGIYGRPVQSSDDAYCFVQYVINGINEDAIIADSTVTNP